MNLMSVLGSDLFLSCLSTVSSIGIPIYMNKRAYNDPEAFSPPKDHLISLLAKKILGTDQEVRIRIESGPILSALFNETPLENACVPIRAEGSAILGSAMIYMDPAYDAISDIKKEFIIAHELIHIAKNDLIVHSLYSAAMGTIKCIGIKHLYKTFSMKSLFISVMALGIFHKITKFFHCYLEKRADLLGFAACSKEGKIEGIRFFESFTQANLAVRKEILLDEAEETESNLLFKTYYSLLKNIYTEDGNFGLDFFHPPLTERITYLKQAYQKEYEEVYSTI